MLFPDGHSTARTDATSPTEDDTSPTEDDVGKRLQIIFQQTGTPVLADLMAVSPDSGSRCQVKFADGSTAWVDLGEGEDQNRWRFEKVTGSNKSGSSPEENLKDPSSKEGGASLESDEDDSLTTDGKKIVEVRGEVYEVHGVKDPSSGEVIYQESSATLDEDGAFLESDEDASPTTEEKEKDFVCFEGVVYEVHDVPGDGSCFYHALLQGDFSDEIEHSPPTDPFELRKLITQFVFKGIFFGEELDDATQKHLRKATMEAKRGRKDLEMFARNEKTTFNEELLERTILNKDRDFAEAYFGGPCESMLFALMFNVNVTLVSNTHGGFLITQSKNMMETYNLEEIANKLHPEGNEVNKPSLVLYQFLSGSPREPRALEELNHYAVLKPVDQSKIRRLWKKGLVHANDPFPDPPTNKNPIDVDRRDSHKNKTPIDLCESEDQEKLSNEMAKKMMAELSVVNVGDKISFTSRKSKRVREGVVKKLPSNDSPVWHITHDDGKFRAYNLLGYDWKIVERKEAQAETGETGTKNKEGGKKTNSVHSASAPDAMSIEAAESVSLSQKEDQEPKQPTDVSQAAPSTVGVEDSTPEIGTVDAMSTAATAPSEDSSADPKPPNELGEANPGRRDDGKCGSGGTDELEQSIWDQAKEVLTQRKLPKIVEAFLGLVEGDGRKFYLTKEQGEVIDAVHFLEDSRTNCKHGGNFQYDSSASLREMFAMCYFLTEEACLLEMYQEILIDEKSVEDGGFFTNQDDEKFKHYRDKMKNTIVSLSIMLCPGIYRKTKKKNLTFSNYGERKTNWENQLKKTLPTDGTVLLSPGKRISKGYIEFDPEMSATQMLLGVEHQSSYLVDFLLMPRAMCSSLSTKNVCVTEAVGCVDTNHRKVDTSVMEEKESGKRSLREAWNCSEDDRSHFMGEGSTIRTSALFERKINEDSDQSQSNKGNDCREDLTSGKARVHLEGCMHFQKRECQEVVGPSLLEAATLLLVTLVSQCCLL